MADLVRFVESPAGMALYSVSQHYGLDPAAGMTDDVLAHNLRTALMVAHAGPEPEPTFEEKFA